MNMGRHIDYWRKGADEEWEMAEYALNGGKLRHALFFFHLSMEKLLKALVCRQTEQPPPRIHNLVRLAELAQLDPGKERLKLFLELNDYCMEGRYPDEQIPLPFPQEVMNFKQRTLEARQWLLNLL